MAMAGRHGGEQSEEEWELEGAVVSPHGVCRRRRECGAGQDFSKEKQCKGNR